MMKVSRERFWEVLARLNERGEQRVGQFFMNELVPTVTDPEIFNEERDDISIPLFVKRYVNEGAE